jgi:poly-gamma-glutamate capsule biosynthesis protein CapA/YwtB (metallophosphatase superfamily)
MSRPRNGSLRLMLCGDVMTGRGIDQVLPHPCPPVLYESHVKSAFDYVRLAEEANGPIEKPVAFPYVWGDALDVLERVRPDLRIINLETAVTRSERPAAKGINYRISPDNVACLTAAGIDCCVLANNHVLDWGRDGLAETLATLQNVHIPVAGAGHNRHEAEAAATLGIRGKGRVQIYGIGCPSSGIPAGWAAADARSGVNLLARPSAGAAQPVAERIRRDRQSGDVVVVSIHWNANWGYEIADRERAFAHALIDAGAADIVHGHSSHHPKAIEVYRGRPILHGCGDLINDYEGISGHEAFRGDLSLMYFVELNRDEHSLVSLEMVPFQMRRFRLNRVGATDTEWLHHRMDRECRRFGGRVDLDAEGTLRLTAA